MTDIAALAARVDKLEHELGIQQDIHQIRRVQYTYGYFIDKSQYDEVVDLFSDDAEVWFLGGVYKGKAGVRRLYLERFRAIFTQGHNGPRYGWLLDHPQLQMVIDVADDRLSATVRGRSMMQAGTHETAETAISLLEGATAELTRRVRRSWWEGGVYDNRYVRDNGVWKISRIGYFPFWHGTFEAGWEKIPVDYIPTPSVCYPEDPLGPDYILSPQPRLWPATDIVPFPYNHPVTGQPIVCDNSRAREGFKD
jgi:SnoaL-like domain